MKIKFLILSIFTPFLFFAQYNKFSVEPHGGVTKIRDVTQVEPYNAGLGLRYMFNTKFGFRVNGVHTEIDRNDDYFKYNSFALEGVTNAGRIMGFEDFAPWYTILVGVGGTYTYSSDPTNYQILHRYSNFHLSGTIDNEVKLSNALSAKASLNVITGVNDRPFTPNSTETTSIINFNAGLVLSFGKNKEHADWYVPKDDPDTITIDRTITKREVYVVTVDNTTTTVLPREMEYVFFHFNNDVVDKDGLNAINKSADKLTAQNKIIVIGYACPDGSPQYNIDLSKRRAEAVKEKLVGIGIEEHQIEVIYKGRDETRKDQNVHDLARRVALIVK